MADFALAPALTRGRRRCFVAQVIGHTALLYRRRAGRPVVDLDALVRADPNDLLGDRERPAGEVRMEQKL